MAQTGRPGQTDLGISLAFASFLNLKTGSSENIQAEIQLWIPVAFLFSFLTADMNGLQAMAMRTMQRLQLQEQAVNNCPTSSQLVVLFNAHFSATV